MCCCGDGFADRHVHFWRQARAVVLQGGRTTANPFQRECDVYENWQRSAYDPWFPAESATYHSGTRQDVRARCLLAVRRAAAGGKQAIEEIGPLLFKSVCDARMLRCAWDMLARFGGHAPGPDGRRYDDLDDHEVWGLLTALGQAIRKGTYRPGPVRTVSIWKDRTNHARGKRTLTLLNIADRVVQRAIVELLQPLLDPLFGDRVLGFRSRVNRVDALALAERLTMTDNRFVWAIEDIKDAFDNVPRGPLIDVVAKYVPSPELMQLIEKIICADGRKRGIAQGGPLSPLQLNVYVFHHLERRWEQNEVLAGTPHIRVADDILMLCKTLKEAREALSELKRILGQAGLPLKHGASKAIHHLRRGDSPDWLGFRVWRGREGLEIKIAKRSWKRLSQYLQLTHEKPDAPLRAVDTINGWVDQLGPCYRYGNRSRKCRRIETFAGTHGFGEIPSRASLLSRWRRAYERWEEMRVVDAPEVDAAHRGDDHDQTYGTEGVGPAVSQAPF